jgi:large subunit ribosomal protein L15
MSRKKSRMRGSKTHGYGSKKKHRGKGSRGGVGLANIFKHKRVWVKKKRPDLLKRNVGFKSLEQRGMRTREKTINVGDLDKILKDGKKEINLSDYGYDKLLGSGSMKTKVRIRVNSFTERAEEKVLKAGGQIIKDESDI